MESQTDNSVDQLINPEQQTATISFGAQVKPGVIDPRHLVPPLTPKNGDMFYSNGTIFKKLAPGTAGQILTTTAGGAPSWAAAASATGPVSRVATGPAYIYPTTSGDTIRALGTGTDYMDMKYALSTATISTSTGPIVLTPAAGSLVKFQAAEQVTATTNTNRANTVIESGWNFITGDGSNTDYSTTITFPKAFTIAPTGVILSQLGYKDTSDPTAIGDFTSNTLSAVPTLFQTSSIGLTTMAVKISFAAAFTNGRRFGFSWICIGAS